MQLQYTYPQNGKYIKPACTTLVFSDNLLLKWNDSVVVFSKKRWRGWRRDQLPTIFHFCSELNSENLYYLQCYIIQLYIPLRILHPFCRNFKPFKRWEKEREMCMLRKTFRITFVVVPYYQGCELQYMSLKSN